MLALPAQASAYSYGDPNKEEIAEAYKDIAAALSKSPEDWNGAYQAFSGKKAEIKLEFGDSVAQTLENNFTQKQKDLVLNNYKAVLVLNIDRRLDNAEKQFSDYSKAKLLLAKARGTFNVLESSVSAATGKKVYDGFDQALKALGNPGLFGVGTEPADKDAFLKQTAQIRASVKPLFVMKKASAQAQAPAKTPVAPAPKPAATTPAKPATTQTAPATKPAAAPAQPQATTAQPAATAQTAQTPATTTTPAADAKVSPATAQPAQGTTTATGTTPAATPAAPAITTDSKQTSATTASENTQATSASAEVQTAAAHASASDSAADSASSKVNPLVTVSVIGGLLILIGGAFWLGKRKGLI